MKIYTYYENLESNHKNLPHDNQREMLRLWQTSWKNAGFEPIVLDSEEAKKHPFYEEFIDQLKALHVKIMNKPITDYGLACYIRWMAYATQDDEYFYVSDYDCVNNGLKPIITTDKLHLMDCDCPCFASGNPKHFENLCHLFVDISVKRTEDIILKTKENQHVCYHDQEFCILNLLNKNNQNAAEILHTSNIMMTRDRKNGVGPFETGKKNTLKVLHISHHNAGNIKKATKGLENMCIDEVRIQITKQIVERQIQMIKNQQQGV